MLIFYDDLQFSITNMNCYLLGVKKEKKRFSETWKNTIPSSRVVLSSSFSVILEKLLGIANGFHGLKLIIKTKLLKVD